MMNGSAIAGGRVTLSGCPLGLPGRFPQLNGVLRFACAADCRFASLSFHKSGNVLDKLPKRLQAGAKEKLHQIWMADTRKAAYEAFDLFVAAYQAKYPKAADSLQKDREELLAFYDFPAEHWGHLRTTNPIESVFATLKHRQKKTRGNGSRVACLAMVFKLAQSASKKWRALNGSSLLPDVIQGITYINGVKQTEAAA